MVKKAKKIVLCYKLIRSRNSSLPQRSRVYKRIPEEEYGFKKRLRLNLGRNIFPYGLQSLFGLGNGPLDDFFGRGYIMYSAYGLPGK